MQRWKEHGKNNFAKVSKKFINYLDIDLKIFLL